MSSAAIDRTGLAGVFRRWFPVRRGSTSASGEGSATSVPAAVVYSEAFFEEYLSRSLRSARAVLPAVLERIPARSVIDVGCGWGAWLQAARELGVERVLGVDGEYVDRHKMLIREEEFVPCRLDRDPGALAMAAGGVRFELACCLEVAEHLPEAAAAPLVEGLTTLSDVVLFSAAVPFQGGTHHVNEQWPEFWALLFRSRGYLCSDFLRRQFWTSPLVDWWYAQNLLLFVRSGTPAARRVPIPETPAPLAAVHPCNYLCRAVPDGHVHFPSLRALSAEWLAGPGASGGSE
jgi:hypothetical protein